MRELLRVEDLRAGYGSAPVLHGLTLTVNEGEIAVLLGANGVGKTTTLRSIAGTHAPWGGSVVFDGHEIARKPAEKVVRYGLGMVPAPPGVFRDLTVYDNLRAGAFAIERRRVERQIQLIFDAFPILAERRAQIAGSLSGGEQRSLAVARALVGSPRLLLVDEVSMGLSPVMTSNVLQVLSALRAEGLTILMAEQNVAALDVADRAFVMEKGRIVRTDAGAQLVATRAEAARAYLGSAV